MTEASLMNESNKEWPEPETAKLLTSSGILKIDNISIITGQSLNDLKSKQFKPPTGIKIKGNAFEVD